MRKTIAMLGLMLAFISCNMNKNKEIKGFIADATMNTVTVKSSDNDSLYVFSLENANKDKAYGLLLGNLISVEYSGDLRNVTPAIKIETNITYAKAVGRWTMPDPINPGYKIGINIMTGGEAESINMETLVYTSWGVGDEDNKIILHGQSIGNGQTFDFTENGFISQKEDKLYLSIEGTEVVYEREPYTYVKK